MRNIKISVQYILLLGLIVSCTSNFEEVNKDPNRIGDISPGTLLNPIIYGVTAHNIDRGDDIDFNLMQVSLPFPSVSGGLHRYDLSQEIGGSSWQNYYKWLANIKEMRDQSEMDGDNNYLAIALTLNAWVYSQLTDCFGPVPMTEAVSGEDGIFAPEFNSQQEIYETILADLEEANTLYDPEENMVYSEDILFGNDVAKWQKFTNSLLMRLLLRVSNRAETNAFQRLSNMLDNPDVYPVFTSNEEAAVLDITGVTPNISPYGRPQDFRLFVVMTAFFIDNLNDWEDPRRPIIATEAQDSDGNPIGYKGIPSAYAGPESQFNYTASTFNIAQVENPMKGLILTYSEVEFIKAELALKGYGTNAQEHYENGVQAAIELKGIEMPADYFDNPLTSYNGTLERIMIQKYYALYFNDYQQWFEYRRTGLPVLPTTTAMENNGVMPSRFYYPSDIQINNPGNYQNAIELLGGPDDINTKVWWDQ